MIALVLFDIDGVLTDGYVYVGADGKETKRISYDDIDAIFELKRAGVKIGFLTGENSSFAEYVKNKFEPDFFVAGAKDKLSTFTGLETGAVLDPATVCFVGDSKKDLELLRHVGHSFVPSDVPDDIKESGFCVTRACRGNGVIREVAAIVLRHNS